MTLWHTLNVPLLLMLLLLLNLPLALSVIQGYTGCRCPTWRWGTPMWMGFSRAPWRPTHPILMALCRHALIRAPVEAVRLLPVLSATLVLHVVWILTHLTATC